MNLKKIQQKWRIKRTKWPKICSTSETCQWFKRSTKYIIGVSNEKHRKHGAKNIVEEITAGSLLNSMKDIKLQIQKVQWTPSRINTKKISDASRSNYFIYFHVYFRTNLSISTKNNLGLLWVFRENFIITILRFWTHEQRTQLNFFRFS